jgi:hypothetical protein
MFSSAVGHLNGRIARQQQLARAVGPLAVAWTASHVGYRTVFAIIAITFTVISLVSGAGAATAAVSVQKETA